jgi:hypothetical protein
LREHDFVTLSEAKGLEPPSFFALLRMTLRLNYAEPTVPSATETKPVRKLPTDRRKEEDHAAGRDLPFLAAEAVSTIPNYVEGRPSLRGAPSGNGNGGTRFAGDWGGDIATPDRRIRSSGNDTDVAGYADRAM